MGSINIAVKNLPGTVANNIKQKHSTHAKINCLDSSNSKLKLYKIQYVTVIGNPKLENEEDVAEDIAKSIEEAYSVVIWYMRFIPFFGFFASNFFGKDYFCEPVQISQISSLFLILFLRSSQLYKRVTK